MVFIPILILVLMVWPAFAADMPGPVRATLVRVIDGNTVEADAHIWPGHIVRVSVRLRGIDAPELRTRCDSEKQAAIRARDSLVALLQDGVFQVRNIEGDKYFGRVVADIETPDGAPVAARLLATGLVRLYDGKTRGAWCEPGSG